MEISYKIEFRPTGPANAKLMIVGEAPGKTEVEKGLPFVGASGMLLDEMLRARGMNRGQAFVTNVVRERPPKNDVGLFFAERKKDITLDHRQILGKWVDPRVAFGIEKLKEEIRLVQPEGILAFGNVAMWALTGHWGIKTWRGSELQGGVDGVRFQIIPTYHPAAVFREQSVKELIQIDLNRAAAKFPNGREVRCPAWRFIVRPTFEQALRTLMDLWGRLERSKLPLKVSADIETRGGHIACVGLAWNYLDAICIPLMCVERISGYWTPEQEWRLIKLIRAILTHPRAHVVGQNWNYDRQYFHRWHGYTANLGSDTMAKHHSMFCNSPKGLGHLSSLYCEYHRYWKDDGRLWDPSMDEEQFWNYNCEDCVRTLEVDDREDELIAHLTPEWPKLPEVVAFQHKIHAPVFKMMVRGFAISETTKGEMARDLIFRSMELQRELDALAARPLKIGSPKDMASFFYEELYQQPVMKRRPDGTYGITTDDDALMTIASREPLLARFVARVQALRSIATYQGNYIAMRKDIDGRMRCSFGVAATVSYRFNSSESAFGSGRNLQNIPGEDDIEAPIRLPNIRKVFVPDPNRTIFDLDGDSADLRIVTWESGCRAMKDFFAAGVKPYVEIAKEFYRNPAITKKHPSYPYMKALCHGSNYGGTGPGLAHRIGLLVHEVDRMQKWYFGLCPEIKAWQEDIKAQIKGRGWIENPFGYRIYFKDRLSREAENEALAWTPQSSVGQIINRVMDQLDLALPWCELLLQVHDSLTGQYPRWMGGEAQREILAHSKVEVPCKTETIIIPMGIKTSDISWGDCE